MFEKLLSGSDLLSFPIIAMIFFMVFFLGVVLRVMSRKRAGLYEHMSQLPLDDRDPNEVAEQEMRSPKHE